MRTLQQVEDRVTVFRLIDRARGWQDTPLTAREIKVLLWKYGFLGGDLTLQEVGEELGLSRERIRQIECRAIKKLRRAVAQCNPKYKYLDLPPARRHRYYIQVQVGRKRPPTPSQAQWHKPRVAADEMAPGTMRLTCDLCVKQIFQDGGIYHSGGPLKPAQLERLRALARKHGWVVYPGRELCPKCWDRMLEQMQSPQTVEDALTKA